MGEKKLHESIEVMLTEYKTIRKHITESIDHQLKIYSIIVTALGVIYGIIFAYNEARDLILLIPLIILPLGLRFQFEDYAVDEYGKYLLKLEEKIQKKDTLLADGWEGWQHHWLKNKNEWLVLLYSVGSKWLLFILIPMGVSILYSSVVLFKNIDISNIPSNMHYLHWISMIIYISFILATCIYFIIYKKIYKEIYLDYKKKKQAKQARQNK